MICVLHNAHAIRYSDWKKAREDAKSAYEHEISSRIADYTSARHRAKLNAESFGNDSNGLYNRMFSS